MVAALQFSPLNAAVYRVAVVIVGDNYLNNFTAKTTKEQIQNAILETFARMKRLEIYFNFLCALSQEMYFFRN